MKVRLPEKEINMPNWCMNTLTVSGNERKLAEFMERAKHINHGGAECSTDLSLHNFLPTPPELLNVQAPNTSGNTEELIKRYGSPDWYHWNVQNWGCKWDLTARIVLENAGRTIYEFESPWTPPLIGIRKISELFPDLEFHISYEEPGMGFGGTTIYSNGNTISCEEHDVGLYEEEEEEEEKPFRINTT